MQRCLSGRKCSLGTAVYGNVPRVRIPFSAPIEAKRKRILTLRVRVLSDPDRSYELPAWAKNMRTGIFS